MLVSVGIILNDSYPAVYIAIHGAMSALVTAGIESGSWVMIKAQGLLGESATIVWNNSLVGTEVMWNNTMSALDEAGYGTYITAGGSVVSGLQYLGSGASAGAGYVGSGVSAVGSGVSSVAGGISSGVSAVGSGVSSVAGGISSGATYVGSMMPWSFDGHPGLCSSMCQCKAVKAKKELNRKIRARGLTELMF